ncbi:MAG: hypothetical protein DHS20C15_05870 [Planctomycetota bacterium]|nr:MAG: hypothetical protein DHS20C15_05870 [Planctomycetota bacterium]
MALCVLGACGDAGERTSGTTPSRTDSSATAPDDHVLPLSDLTQPAPALHWQLVSGLAEVPPGESLAQFELPASGAVMPGWEIVALRSARQRLPAKKEVAIVIRAPQGRHELELVHAGPAPERADVLRVTAAFEGAGVASLELWRGDERVAVGAPVVMRQAEQLVAHRIPLPVERPEHDRVVMSCTGSTRRLGLAALSWETSQLGAGLPTLSAPELVARGTRWLRAGVLFGESSARLDAPLPAGHGFELPYALVTSPHSIAQAESNELVLRTRPVGAGDDSWIDHVLPLDPGDDWQLSPLAVSDTAREVELRFRAGSSRAVLLAEPRLSLPAAPDVAPLVLLVSSDAHRGDHLGLAFRGVDMPTPQLDALAAEGLFFADARAPTNHSAPALAALHTGLSARDTGVVNEGQHLRPEARTLAEAFAHAGYRCVAVVGSQHLTPGSSGLGQGFAEVVAPADSTAWSAQRVVDEARAQLAEQADTPLFLWLALSDARWPHEPAPESLALHYDPLDRDGAHQLPTRGRILVAMPESYRAEHDLNFLRARYKGEISELDAALAPLLSHPRVRAAPRAFVGSHGLALGEHQIWFKSLGLYPGVLHVPLILASPQLEQGARRNDPVSTLDLGRSLLDLAGLGDQAFPGRSLLRPRDELEPRFAVESDGLSASITRGERHLVVQLRPRRLGHLPERRQAFTAELFDLSVDPQALHALAADELDSSTLDSEGEGLRAELTAWLAAQPDTRLDELGVLDDSIMRERLSLGYVGPLPPPFTRLLDEEACPWCAR